MFLYGADMETSFRDRKQFCIALLSCFVAEKS